MDLSTIFRVAEAAPPTDVSFRHEPDANRLRRVLARIPDPLRDIQGYGHIEIAQVLRVNYNTVR